MKNLRKMAGAAVLLTFVFMVAALFQFQEDDSYWSPLPDQYEYYVEDDWVLVSLALEGNHLYDIASVVQDALDAGEGQKVKLPHRGTKNKSEVLVFQNTLTEKFAGLTLSFVSTNASVHVVLDGETIYQYGFDDTRIEKVHGSNEHFVTIPNTFEDGELWIELMSPYPDMVAELSKVQLETRDMVIIGVIGGNVADIGCCLLMLFMASIMIMIAIIRWYTHQPQRGEVYLGLSGIAAGVYCFIETDTLSIFYNMYSAYAVQEYLILLIPLFLALYFEQNMRSAFARRFSVLLICTNVNAFVQIMLQMFGLCSMERMLDISAVITCVVCVMAIVSLVQFDYMYKRLRTLLSLIALAVLLTGEVTNVIVKFVTGDLHESTAVQYAMAIFSVLMAAIHILQLSREYREKAEENAHLLEEKIRIVEEQYTQLALAKQDADAARQEALAANEAKGKFLAHMSHEIRTPINAVLGMDEMILRETSEPQVKEYAMDIYTAGQTLLSLINDILDFSKIDSGKMEIVPVKYDISSMLHDLASMASQRADNKNIRFEMSVDAGLPSRLYGDDVRIRQVLTNILTNAVKYTHEGCVCFRVRGRIEGDMVTLTFEVEDTGIGIRAEDLPKLSAEFERIEVERNRNIEGTGLGMNITIQLLSLLGSRLQVESDYGKGSKFYFDLEQKIVDHTPVGDFEARVQQIAQSYDYSTKFCAPDARILVVDDNAVNRRVLRNLLKDTLVQVVDVESGEECLQQVKENHFDLILLDHMMPGMDGVETLHRIKALYECPCRDTPVVVLTANAVSGAREMYLSEGFDDFLSKPVVPKKLENMIQKMLPDNLVKERKEGSNDKGTVLSDRDASAKDMLDALPQVDGLDWQYAWLHLADMGLLEYTVKEFHSQIDMAAARLEQSYRQLAGEGQLEQYRIQVHAMKGLAATVGLMTLSGVARLLENAAKDGDVGTVQAVTPIFLQEWRSYRTKLQGVFGITDEAEAAREEVCDRSVLLALVEMVRFGVQEMDIDQADQHMKRLQAYRYPVEIEQNIQKLAGAVVDLDAKATDRYAALLINQLTDSH